MGNVIHDLAEMRASLDLALTAASFPGDPAALMQARDRPAFEREWLRVYDRARKRRERVDLSRSQARALDSLAEFAYKRAFKLTDDQDLAAQVSDDILLIGGALLSGFEDEWLNALWTSYREGAFPHQRLAPLKGTLRSFLGAKGEKGATRGRQTRLVDKRFKQLQDRSSGAVFEGFDLERCEFDNCLLSFTTDPATRSVVRNVSAKDCTVFNCHIGPAIFDEVVIDGLRTGDIALLWGSLFRHVTLKGKIGPLKINTMANVVDLSAAAQEPFHRERSAFYRGLDWALDIREALVDDLNISGVPARLVRRDPATQVVVTRERALRPGWRRKVSKVASHWIAVIDVFLGENEPDLILAAPKGRTKKLRALLDGLQALRDVGVVEPEGAVRRSTPRASRKPARSRSKSSTKGPRKR